FGVPTTPELADALGDKQKALVDALPTTGRKPLCLLAPSERLSDALPAASVERIAHRKEERDPDGTIRGNFSARG
ncbi:MAG: hypothetical protein ACTHX2_12040, partial [Microbacterium sp.]